jgi:PII-like signaling protein
MKGFQLEFFMEQNKRHGHQGLWEWLFALARDQGIAGATVVMGTMGFGHHRRIHAAHFFELADQPVEVTMIVTEEEAQRLFALLDKEQVRIFYARMPVEFGFTGEPGQ